MNKLFLVNKGIEYTYEKLFYDLSIKEDYQKYIYIKNNDPYEIFLSILCSLMHGYSVELIDGDFSESELEEIGLQKKIVTKKTVITNEVKYKNIQEIIDYITNNNGKCSISLYTSGTTGRPKKISHSLQSLTRNIKIDKKFNDDIWAFAYNPTHMAGLQVFFQAFLNKNTIVYAFDGQQNHLEELLDKYGITSISATSTYYRNVLPYLRGHVYEVVKRITFGGEKCDTQLIVLLQAIFPKAKMSNIYASTEAGSLFSAHDEVFAIPDRIQSLIKVAENNELFIHKSLLGMFELSKSVDEWYATGDIVEKLDKQHFRFVSRKSDFINVGGYKVNPLEIESILINVPGVIDLVVKAVENRVTGYILAVDIVKESDVEELSIKRNIKLYANEHLQAWKVPRIINIVDKIESTRTGKKVRK